MFKMKRADLGPKQAKVFYIYRMAVDNRYSICYLLKGPLRLDGLALLITWVLPYWWYLPKRWSRV